MTHSVLQLIRDFVLAPALLTSALISTTGAFGLLLALRPEGLRPGKPVVVTAVAYLLAFLLTTIVLVSMGAMEVRMDVTWPRQLGWVLTGLVWAGLVAWRAETAWRTKLIRGSVLGMVMGVAAWGVDAYVVSALLFVE